MNLNRLTIAASAALTGAIVCPAVAFGKRENSSENTPLELDRVEPNHAGASGGGSLVRTFVGLMVVILVIYGVYWVLKQVKSSREERSSGFGLATVASVPLGPGRSLHMVRAGYEVVLVGVADHGVTHIRTYDEHEAKAAGILAERELEAGDGESAERPVGPPTVREFIENLRKRTVRS